MILSMLRLHIQTKGCLCKGGCWPHGKGDPGQLPPGGQLGRLSGPGVHDPRRGPYSGPLLGHCVAVCTSSPTASCHGWSVGSTSTANVVEETSFEGGHTCFHGLHRLGASWGTARWGTVVSSPWQHRWQGHPARGWWRDGWGGWDAAIHLGECNVGQAWLDSPKCR